MEGPFPLWRPVRWRHWEALAGNGGAAGQSGGYLLPGPHPVSGLWLVEFCFQRPQLFGFPLTRSFSPRGGDGSLYSAYSVVVVSVLPFPQSHCWAEPCFLPAPETLAFSSLSPSVALLPVRVTAFTPVPPPTVPVVWGKGLSSVNSTSVGNYPRKQSQSLKALEESCGLRSF